MKPFTPGMRLRLTAPVPESVGIPDDLAQLVGAVVVVQPIRAYQMTHHKECPGYWWHVRFPHWSQPSGNDCWWVPEEFLAPLTPTDDMQELP